jgi:hypothetical protein
MPEIPQVPVVAIPMSLTMREDFAIEGICAARFGICSWARHPFTGENEQGGVRDWSQPGNHGTLPNQGDAGTVPDGCRYPVIWG